MVFADFLLFYLGWVLRLLLFGVFGLNFGGFAPGFGLWFDFGGLGLVGCCGFAGGFGGGLL